MIKCINAKTNFFTDYVTSKNIEVYTINFYRALY